MKKIYYLTQYFDISSDKSLGGILIRKGQIELFQKNGYEVIIVMPDKNISKVLLKNNVIYIPYFNQKQICDILERTALWPDKDFNFSIKAYHYLKNKISNKDYVFCTTGGSLETIILGSKLAAETHCKLIINYQDPINFTSVNGQYVDNSLRFKRDHYEKKYLKNVDLVITSSEINRANLLQKYSFLKADNVVNNYFGYFKNIETDKTKVVKHPVSLMYSGIYGKHQQPEKIAKALKNIKGIDVYFIGNYRNYPPIQPYLNDYHYVDFMPHAEFLNWVQSNISIGLVSLTSEYLGACVPSKIYEYINLNLPIIGFLPDGDAKDIVNNNDFGKIFHYNDETSFIKFINNELNDSFINTCRQNLLLQKSKWSMQYRFKEILNLIDSL